jgi:hypothetical protein
MKVYFTFGQIHRHVIAGVTYDKNTVVEIDAPTISMARQVMFSKFGSKWGMQYDKLPDKQFYKEVIKL